MGRVASQSALSGSQAQECGAVHVPQPGGRALLPADGGVDQVRAPRAHQGALGHTRPHEGPLRRRHHAARLHLYQPLQEGLPAFPGERDGNSLERRLYYNADVGRPSFERQQEVNREYVRVAT
eukprot:CAMPEP_0198229648 /NCGR_PEP_ID=MMETSP1445-20131203/114232_1 /TAXON_ID=36898 /ORGANISM="Pyramimonas sp., Strain CCMP2087" /LENGTH=122 /DNA_ID=CAMNT_0043910115 /DNA_START=721 /DNA_END=1089 /DNA_ORIENTATION=+